MIAKNYQHDAKRVANLSPKSVPGFASGMHFVLILFGCAVGSISNALGITVGPKVGPRSKVEKDVLGVHFGAIKMHLW